MPNDLTADESRDLRALAGYIIPASVAYGVPGADDDQIFREVASGARTALNWPRPYARTKNPDATRARVTKDITMCICAAIFGSSLVDCWASLAARLCSSLPR